MATVEFLDPIYCQVRDREERKLLAPALGYESPRWVRGEYGKREKIMEPRSFLDRRNGRFLAGFYPRILDYCNKKKIPINAQNYPFSQEAKPPHLPGITFRKDQFELLRGVSNWQRGYVKSPTGSGKTVLAGGIFSMFPLDDGLFICHTLDLFTQTIEEFTRWGFKVKAVGGGDKRFDFKAGKERQIVVGMVQTLAGLEDYEDFIDWANIIIVDECHHITDKDGIYARVLERTLAPVRIGLTATDPPKETIPRLTLEGYLGPMIGEFTLEEGIDKGILAKPEVEWINVPIEDHILQIKNPTYKRLYEDCVVESRAFSRLVMTEALAENEMGNSVLILVKEVDHGRNLMRMAELLRLPVKMVWSGVTPEDRRRIRADLEDKSVLCVIATTTWKEAVNIKSLDVVINAAGGLSEIWVLQTIGRGLRATAHKTTMRLKDFVFGYKYLSHHTAMRLRIYVEHGWKMKGA